MYILNIVSTIIDIFKYYNIFIMSNMDKLLYFNLKEIFLKYKFLLILSKNIFNGKS